jgi:hypothetical protein
MGNEAKRLVNEILFGSTHTSFQRKRFSMKSNGATLTITGSYQEAILICAINTSACRGAKFPHTKVFLAQPR